jgi:hypothetical protein
LNLTPIAVLGDETLNPKQDYLVGEIYKGKSWNGHSVLFDHDDWILRPGELVKVDLNTRAADLGLYVPVRAIRHESGQTFVFTVVDEGNLTRTQKVEVRLVSGESAQQSGQQLLQIQPLVETSLDGQQIIVGGVHYIQDGEIVRVTRSWDGEQ